jgi:hypothetical protein
LAADKQMIPERKTQATRTVQAPNETSPSYSAYSWKTSHTNNETTNDLVVRGESANGYTQTVAATNLTELVTERQVSERWNVSLNTLRYWRSAGEGPPYVKIGRTVRYNVSALEKYLRRNTCESKMRATAEEALQRVAH